MSTRLSTRLTRSDWLQAGFTALSEIGPDALKAEPLARRLGTTKGSFYWHFEDVPAFHAVLLQHWEGQAIAALNAELSRNEDPVPQLRRVAQALAVSDTGIDPAMRAWARGHTLAAKTVTRVNGQRQDSVEVLLGAIGIRNPEMARIICAAAIGMQDMQSGKQPDPAEAMGSLVDLILALR